MFHESMPKDLLATRMHLLRIFQLFFILAGFCLLACTPEPKLSRLAGDAEILAFGDSLTYGTGALPGESYPAVLEELTGRHVINAGVPGEVSGEGLPRLQALLEREKPDLLVLCHGGNDLLRRSDREQIRQNLKEMISAAGKRGVSVVLIAVPAPGIFLKPPRLYEEIASDMKIPLEDEILKTILADDTLKSDAIHPNAAGYRRLAEAVLSLLQKSGAL